MHPTGCEGLGKGILNYIFKIRTDINCERGEEAESACGILGQQVGLPGVRFLTGQSGFLVICPVKNMMLNRTISCPVFGRP